MFPAKWKAIHAIEPPQESRNQKSHTKNAASLFSGKAF